MSDNEKSNVVRLEEVAIDFTREELKALRAMAKARHLSVEMLVRMMIRTGMTRLRA